MNKGSFLSFLFPNQYNFDALLKSLTTIMLQETQIGNLTHQLLAKLTAEMGLSDAAFVILKEGRVRSVEFIGFGQQIPLSNTELESLLKFDDKIILFKNLVNEQDKEFFRQNHLSVIIPLKVQNERVGFLLLGPKSSGATYTQQDLEFLDVFAPQAGIALRNAQNYREIQEFNMTLASKVEERTRELKKLQEQELKLKDEFVFIATHDLATPVTAIAGFLDLINKRQETLSSELKANLGAISEASNRLKVLVNDLLEVARSDAGTIKVNLSPLDIVPIIDSVIREVMPMAKAKNITMSTEFGGKHTVQADAKKFTEIVENLVSNAIKYNKEGGSLKISGIERDKRYLLVFKDTGLGIPENEQKQVFTKFFRSESAEVRQHPGTGLGLFVVRMLVEKMNGKISFESKVGVGTTFWLDFEV